MFNILIAGIFLAYGAYTDYTKKRVSNNLTYLFFWTALIYNLLVILNVWFVLARQTVITLSIYGVLPPEVIFTAIRNVLFLIGVLLFKLIFFIMLYSVLSYKGLFTYADAKFLVSFSLLLPFIDVFKMFTGGIWFMLYSILLYASFYTGVGTAKKLLLKAKPPLLPHLLFGFFIVVLTRYIQNL